MSLDPMEQAILEAEEGLSEGGIPIGAVLVRGEDILGRGRNRRVQLADPVSHAEIECLRNAGRIGSYAATTLYSTLMPCYLCAGAVVQFRIGKVVVGEDRNFAGALGFLRDHGVEVCVVDIKECVSMMRRFIELNPSLWYEDIAESRLSRCN